MRYAMGMQGDGGYGLFRAERTQHLDDGRHRQTGLVRPMGLHLDEISVACAFGLVGGHHEFGLLALYGLDAAAAAPAAAENTERQNLLAVQNADHTCRGSTFLVVVQMGQNPVADACRRSIAGLTQPEARFLPELFLVPRDGFGDQAAIVVAAPHIGYPDGRPHARRGVALAPALEDAFRLKVVQDVLQRGAHVAFDTEGFGDVTLGRPGGVFRDEAQHFLAGKVRPALYLLPGFSLRATRHATPCPLSSWRRPWLSAGRQTLPSAQQSSPLPPSLAPPLSLREPSSPSCRFSLPARSGAGSLLQG